MATKKQTKKSSSFIKLTRLDGSPIWLNASFVVTVEPRTGGGAVVVPIGDGLDYDVRETPETVLALLDGAPVPEVVPVPTTDALTPTPDDVSPEPEAAASAADGKPPKKVPRKAPARRQPSAGSAPQPVFEPRPINRPVVDLLEDELARLRKMAPRTVKKLQNTVMTQFKGVNAESVVTSLAARGIISIDGTHVNWLQPGEQVAAPPPVAEPEKGKKDNDNTDKGGSADEEGK